MPTKRALLTTSAIAGIALMGLSEATYAQSLAIEEITVSARKRDESLLEIPVAITAFSADDIERAGFQNLEDLSLQVAGLQFSSQSGQLSGRIVDSIRFRGMNVDSTLPTEQLGALFVDGVYVLGGSQSIPFLNLERVEVIKGPQSAYFGRSTFGGVVNYVTANPSLTDFGGKIVAEARTKEQYDVAASLDIPLIEDKLALQVGARGYTRGGIFDSSDGGELGEESSYSIDGTIYWEPTDNLWVKFRGFHAFDDDGPAAAGYVTGRLNDTCLGNTTTSPAGETINPIRWFCGKVPEPGEAIAPDGTLQIINTNTTLISPTTAITSGDANRQLDFFENLEDVSSILDVPELDRLGLRRSVERLSLQVEYTFDNDWTLFAQGAINETGTTYLRSFVGSIVDQSFSRDPREQSDKSAEVRLTSAQDGDFRWTFGANWYDQKFTASTTGGDVTLACIDDLTGVLEPGNCRTNQGTNPFIFFGGPGSFRTGGGESDLVTTIGVFGGADYDITDQITISFEGRYQEDEITKGNVSLGLGQTVTYKAFLPRAIISYQVNDDLNTYFSYAKGVLPGVVNQEIVNADAQELAQYTAQFPNAEAFLSKQTLKMYELGVKQNAFDGRLSYSLAAYWGRWTNPVGRATAQIQETCDLQRVGQPGCLGSENGEADFGELAIFPDGSPFINNRVFRLGGVADIWGFEFEGTAVLAEGWTASTSVAWAPSEFKEFEANFIQPFGGYSNAAGASFNRYPEWTASLTSTYTTALTSEWDGFVRGDVIYFGKTFPEVDNLAYCDSYVVAHARLGIENDNMRVEAFVRNLTNDDSYTACQRFSDFGGDVPADFGGFLTAYQGVQVSPQVPRQWGIRTSINF